jgi:putative oxidoreductase
MSITRTILRVTIGGLFIGHGTQKLFGWFGGKGLDATADGFEHLGLRPGRPNAIAAGVTETGGGALLVLGGATPFAAAGLIGTMITAIKRVHRTNGPWASDGGFEYHLVMIGALLTLVEGGPGPLSIDRASGNERRGVAWAAWSLVAGVAGAAAVDSLARRASAESAASPLRTVSHVEAA